MAKQLEINKKKKNLYITDEQNKRTIKLDFEFKTIKTIGSLGSSFNQFNTPPGISCKDGILNICDFMNTRIQIYNKDLEFIGTIKMDYNPYLIKITNSLLFVQTANKRCLFIYELNCLSLKQKIDNPAEYCCLSVINSNVYRYNS